MIKALLFDVFGTVVDWRTGIAREVEILFSQHSISVDPIVFAVAWRAKYQPAMEKIRRQNRSYVALDILHRENLDANLADFALTGKFDEDTLVRLNHAWEKLPAWPDSSPALIRLKAQYAIATCSNGSIELMTWLAKYANLPWDAILGAPVARAYKPAPSVYLASVSALGLQPENVMMVAAHNSDLAAARKSGLKTAFLPRTSEHGLNQSTDLAPTSNWEVVAADLNDLANRLLT
jgi:2-haloacid dehalogenase